ncbi:non-ribosomal peptide synthetase, partial [Bacillus pseudomycoides]|uniref:non-ribosomal peptide synthetase n=1 Tax=Bacillus pseudomycoides TaxID=64104 RepID=UPI000C01B605
IIRRHEILRTVFKEVEGKPVQVVTPFQQKNIEIIDLTKLVKEKKEYEKNELIKKETHRAFDLNKGPLIRECLIKLDELEHILMLNMHHIISDGWSMDVIIKELSTLYEDFCSGGPSSLSELSIQYADFAVWQRDWLQAGTLEKQLAYWKEQLSGELPVLNLPTDRPRTVKQTYQGSVEQLVLSKQLTQKVRSLSKQEGTTLFMTLLAAFKTLLYRYTGQEDIIVGSPIANRNRSEIEGLVGFFVNTLPLRTKLSGDKTFREVLKLIRETSLEAYAHQDVPFEKLVEEIHPDRMINRNSMFEIIVNYNNFSHIEQNSWRNSDLILSYLEEEKPLAKFPITLYIGEEQDRVRFDLVYQEDLFSEELINIMLKQLEYLIKQFVENAEKSIINYSLITSKSESIRSDITQCLPKKTYPLMSEYFQSWAEKKPEHIALSQGKQMLTYKNLNSRAILIAKKLVEQGVERGEVVGVVGSRSFEVVASILGVFMSGGVLLLIDKNLPMKRKLSMMQESKCQTLLNVNSSEYTGEFEKHIPSLNVICIKTGMDEFIDTEIKRDYKKVQLPKLSATDSAYIFFTSGTTGIPKGVLGNHKGLSHFLNWQMHTFDIVPSDRIAQLTNLSFDVVLRDILLPLTSGATLCLPDKIDDLGSDYILPWLEREKITILHTVPSLAQSWLLDSDFNIGLHVLRWIFFAGEPLSDVLVKRLRNSSDKIGNIVNLYGPTETTLAKCFYIVPKNPLPGIQPIGIPMPETQVLVLSENGMNCGINEPGEIVIRTPFRTLGYINNIEENNNRFVKNIFRDDQEDLLYYTGDRGYYRWDNNLQIIGRNDDQIKIRGIRIDLNEINAIISQHPSVKSSVVINLKNDKKDESIAAYVVPVKDNLVSKKELKNYISKFLPAVMIPTHITYLEQLPLTPNGKVNRKHLPQLPSISMEVEEYEAPRNKVEERISKIWCEILELNEIGIHSNFFELGGHSLLGTQVISRLRKSFNIELSVRSLFEEPTIAGLAKLVIEKKDQEKRIGSIENIIPRRNGHLLEKIDNMSDEEVTILLQNLLANKGDKK